MQKDTITRQQLYDLVWSTPMTTLAKKYAISDVGLRKICKKMEIPTPKAGYWEKLRVGAMPPKDIMDANYSGDQEIILKIRQSVDVDGEGFYSELVSLEKEIECQLNEILIVPDKLIKPDKLIMSAKESFNREIYYPHHGLIYTGQGELSITVSKKNVPRALRFMNTFVKAIKVRGHQIERVNQSFCMIIEGEALKFYFREILRREKAISTYEQTIYHPTDILCLQVEFDFDKVEFKDGSIPIEKRLAKIIAKIELKAKELKEKHLRWQKEWEIRDAEERIRKEYEKKKETELLAFKELLEKARRWQKTKMLRGYIEEIKSRAVPTNCSAEEFNDWILWAEQKIDWFDPQIEAEDLLLQGVDRSQLGEIEKKKVYGWQ